MSHCLAWLRQRRVGASILADAVLVFIAWQATYLFRLGFERWWSARPAYDGWVVLGVILTYAAVAAALRLPQAVWRYTGFTEIRRLAVACAAAGCLVALVVSVGLGLSKVPRAVLGLHPLFTLMALSMARLLVRSAHEQWGSHLRRGQVQRPALVLGAGEAGKRLAAGIEGQGWRILGFLDDDPAKQGARIMGIPVLGPLSATGAWVQRLDGPHCILALPSLSPAERRALIQRLSTEGVPLWTVPSSQELRQGVREVQADDLLGRDPVVLDEAEMAAVVAQQVVAVTGAGGSIGSELCAQVARLGPACLVLIEASEFALYRVEQQLRQAYPAVSLVSLLINIQEGDRVEAAFLTYRVALVLHAAAYKHVPLLEGANGMAALRNNALGTWAVAQAAARASVQRMVLISTDKAVNPTNVMGATKRLAEQVVVHWSRQAPATQFMAVRFGNVLGSSGSVIPRFQTQIAQGGPVTVTHPEIIRYFMTIPEASRLVLQAVAIGQTGQVLVLDMGEPVKIVDLAKALIRLSGHSPDDIPIVFTGLRPGEKLFEELLADADRTVPTRCASVRIAQLGDTACTPNTPGGMSDWWEAAHRLVTDAADAAALRAHLMAWVPEYQPTSTPTSAAHQGVGGCQSDAPSQA